MTTLTSTNAPLPQKYYSKQSGQSIHNVNNRSVKEYLLELGVLTVADLPPYLGDCISGSSRVAQRGTQPLNRGQLLQALYALDDINTETVVVTLNRKRIALGDKPFSSAHVATFTSALKNASQAIKHYLR
ncbi:hypothetical protein ACB040_10080 [Aeromonas sp. S11(2024)]|uniref:hypothetical protein n=1 Tax=unclassified Aeromonas TaxID=257493 RepID=UPI003528C582